MDILMYSTHNNVYMSISMARILLLLATGLCHPVDHLDPAWEACTHTHPTCMEAASWASYSLPFGLGLDLCHVASLGRLSSLAGL
jgi:hypothetical protein